MDDGETFFHHLLPSGVHVVGQPMAGVESAAVGILIGAGGVHEQPQQAGISHFTEQMLFRGTARHDARALSDAFDTLGVSYDSSAGLEMTLVSAVLIGTRLPEALALLAEVVHEPAFPDDAVENARSLLIQELRQRDDQPGQKVMDLVRQQFFAGSPLSNDVLGTEDALVSLQKTDLVTYWQEYFTASNMVISVAGNFDWEKTVEQLNVLTADWPTGPGRSEMAAPTQRAAILTLLEDKTQEHLGFAFPGVSIADPRYYANALLSYALGGSSISRLFQEVREKRGLAYAVQSRFDGLQRAGLVRIYVGTSADRAHESVQVVIDELGKLEGDGLLEEELALAKTRLKSQLIMRSESTSARMMANLRSWWFEGRLRSLADIRDEIDRVTVADIGRLIDQLQITDTLAVVALGPRREEELFGGALIPS